MTNVLKATYNSRIRYIMKEVRKAMSEELKRLVEETVTNMKQMDRESLLIMKSNSEVLKIRDSLDKTNSEKRAG